MPYKCRYVDYISMAFRVVDLPFEGFLEREEFLVFYIFQLDYRSVSEKFTIFADEKAGI